MLYESTRGKWSSVTSAEAIKMGIAPDGGLFVPESRVRIKRDKLREMTSFSYNGRAVSILQYFLTDFTEDEIRECVESAYNRDKFDTPEIAPVKKLSPEIYVLELWHGPTCAFKDMALQILPHLLTRAAAKTGEKDEIVILVATSGDTGKAALEGFKDVSGTRIIVFYPARGVSEVQKLQMVTQEGQNVHVIAVDGNFDDTQSGVKAIFGDSEINEELKRNGYRFSSANSINWGRLVPQIVYYFSAYLDLLKQGEIEEGEAVNFVVPTGNFGNILAGFYAREMGLPVKRLVCAANENNVLTEFIRTGIYDRNRKFKRTISPSMDILISSNLERLLYEVTGRDAEAVNRWMGRLKEKGWYDVDPVTRNAIDRVFWSEYATDTETMQAIKETFNKYGYLMDTHTAVGKNVYDKYVMATGDSTKTVLVSTASPFKFNASVARAVLGDEKVAGKSEFELLDVLARISGMPIPPGLKDLDKKPLLHTRTVPPRQMARAVKETLLLKQP